eukprot:COSAG01_NODE_249_length_20357_cov_3.458171_23_plen_201_part_00
MCAPAFTCGSCFPPFLAPLPRAHITHSLLARADDAAKRTTSPSRRRARVRSSAMRHRSRALRTPATRRCPQRARRQRPLWVGEKEARRPACCRVTCSGALTRSVSRRSSASTATRGSSSSDVSRRRRHRSAPSNRGSAPLRARHRPMAAAAAACSSNSSLVSPEPHFPPSWPPHPTRHFSRKARALPMFWGYPDRNPVVW